MALWHWASKLARPGLGSKIDTHSVSVTSGLGGMAASKHGDRASAAPPRDPPSCGRPPWHAARAGHPDRPVPAGFRLASSLEVLAGAVLIGARALYRWPEEGWVPVLSQSEICCSIFSGEQTVKFVTLLKSQNFQWLDTSSHQCSGKVLKGVK